MLVSAITVRTREGGLPDKHKNLVPPTAAHSGGSCKSEREIF